ncbi:FMN-binding protein [Bacteroidota bacterium]
MVLRIFRFSWIVFLFSSSFMFSQDIMETGQNDIYQKKVQKIVSKTFNLDGLTYNNINLPDSIKREIGNSHLEGSFVSLHLNDSIIAYYVITSARGRFDYFDFLIIYNRELFVKKIEILEYRSDHGYQIANKKWLSQFYGIKGCELNYPKDIDAISGASISANSITEKVDQLCKLLFIMIDSD